MYIREKELLEYYKFVGWAEDTNEFINKIKTITATEDITDLIKNIYKQAKKQARLGTEGYPDKQGCIYPKYYIKHRQEILENIAKIAMFEATKFYTNESLLFVFTPHLNGIYVFKQVI